MDLGANLRVFVETQTWMNLFSAVDVEMLIFAAQSHEIMNIIIASDSFKGCLSSVEAGRAMAEGVALSGSDADVEVLPVSDGGEGMLDAFAACAGAEFCELQAHDPLMRSRISRYAFLSDTATAFVELAETAGLTLLQPPERHPMVTTTFGVGETLQAALRAGATRIIIGLGGSATNDGGMGLAVALGYRFLDGKGCELAPCGKSLGQVMHIDDSRVSSAWHEVDWVAACDVQAPLCGPQGAVRVFAAQKGATSSELEELEAGMQHYGKVLSDYCGQDVRQIPGAGAAGGVGAVVMGLLHAQMQSGISLLLRTPRYVSAFQRAHLILTGEGKMDGQTSMGKAAWGVLQEGIHRQVPVWAIAGCVEGRQELLQLGFARLAAATPDGMPLSKALQPAIARQNICQATCALFEN